MNAKIYNFKPHLDTIFISYRSNTPSQVIGFFIAKINILKIKSAVKFGKTVLRRKETATKLRILRIGAGTRNITTKPS